MDTPDSVLVYIKSSVDINFVVLVSKDDDISSLKRKAEAQYVDLFPHKGTIIAQAIKVMRQEIMYYLPDSTPMRFLFDKAGETNLVFMDALVVSPDQTLTSHDKLVSPNAPNRALTSQDDLDVSNRKGADISQVVTPDTILVGVMPRVDENPIGQEEHVPTKHYKGETSSLAPNDSNPEDGLMNTTLTELKDNGKVRERSRSQKSDKNKIMKSQDKSNVAENAGGSSSLAPKVINHEDGLMNTPLTERKDEDKVTERHGSNKSGGNKIKKSHDKSNVTTDSRVAFDEHEKHVRDSVGDGSGVSKGKKRKVVVFSGVVPDELRCRRNSGNGWHCPKEALADINYCYQHSSKTKLHKLKSLR